MTVPVSLATATWESLARAVAARALCACALVALFAVAGCRQQTAPGDPFLPFMKSRVPPPGTTVPAGAGADPYYNGTPGTAPAAGVPVTPVAPVVPEAVDKYSPRGGFNVPQGSIDRSKVIDPRGTEIRASATAITRRTLSTPLAGRSQVDTQLTSSKTGGGVAREVPAQGEPTLDAAMMAFDDGGRPTVGQAAEPEVLMPRSNATTSARPRQLPVSEPQAANPNTVRILAPGEDAPLADDEPDDETASEGVTRLRMTAGPSAGETRSDAVEDLPAQTSSVASAEIPAGDERGATEAGASDPAEGVVQAPWSEPAGSPVAQAVAPAAAAFSSASQPYGYEPSYAALRGRLEYSQSARQWKLRYIPIDGTTDQFGGSVLLPDSAKLEGFKPGDFVLAHGAIAAASPSSRGFSPRYELSQIEPVR